MPPRLDFKTVDAYFDIIADLAIDGYDFCDIWAGYLASAGWTAAQYEQELVRACEREFSNGVN